LCRQDQSAPRGLHAGDRGLALPRVYDRVATLPGVEAATFARYSPFSGSRSVIGATVDGYAPAPGEQIRLETVPVGPNYPRRLECPCGGRAIAVTDDAGAPLVAMVNEAFVHHILSCIEPARPLLSRTTAGSTTRSSASSEMRSSQRS
jgi:hypothetical protein